MTAILTPISQIRQLNPLDGAFTVFQDVSFGKRAYNLAIAANTAAKGGNTGGDMLPVQPIITESTLMVEGNKIAIQNMKQSPTPNRPAQGQLMVANGFQSIITQTGWEELARNITQDQFPDVTYRGGGTKPAVHNMVASTALGTQGTPVTHTIVMVPTTYTFPVRPIVTLSGPTIDTTGGNTNGTVTVTGKDIHGNDLTRVFTWTAANLTTLEMQTTDWFDPQEAMTVVSRGFSAGTIVVSLNDLSRTITFEPNNRPSSFLSFEMNQGGSVPQSFMDSVIERAEIGIAMDAIVANCGVIAAFGRVRQNINGGATPTALPATASRTDAQPYTGVESYFEIDGDRVAMENLTITLVNGFDLPFYHNHSLWSESQPRRSALRMFTVNATLPYDAAQDFETNYLQNRQIDNVKAVLAGGAAGTIGAYDASLVLEMTKGFQMSMPSAQGSGATPLTQNVVIEAFTNAAELDYRFISNQPDLAYNLYNYTP